MEVFAAEQTVNGRSDGGLPPADNTELFSDWLE